MTQAHIGKKHTFDNGTFGRLIMSEDVELGDTVAYRAGMTPATITEIVKQGSGITVVAVDGKNPHGEAKTARKRAARKRSAKKQAQRSTKRGWNSGNYGRNRTWGGQEICGECGEYGRGCSNSRGFCVDN